MPIVVKPLVRQKLRQLLQALLDQDYFSSEEYAESYVLQIYDATQSLPRLQYKSTKDSSYGNYYVTYKANRRTTWYILFDVSGDRYIVRNLINNHTSDYPRFIDSLQSPL